MQNSNNVMPTHADYPKNRKSPWNLIPVGIGEDGEEIVINLKTTPNVLMTGSAGSGKSVLQRSFIAHCLNNPDDWDVVGIDFTKRDLASYKNISPVIVDIATGIEESYNIVLSAHMEMMKRYSQMNEHGVSNFKELPDAPKALMLVIDELFGLLVPSFGELLNPSFGKDNDTERLNDLRLQTRSMIEDLVRLDRAAGIHLVLSTQRPDATVVSRMMKDNLGCRIVCGHADKMLSLMTLDNDNAINTSRYIRGRSYIQVFASGQEFQPYFISWEDTKDSNFNTQH